MQWRNIFSSFKWVQIGVLASSLVLGGCGLNVGEKAAPPETQKFNSRCLADSLPTFKKYFVGETDAESVHRAWTCVRSAIIQFKRYVRSRESSDYPATEFASFVKQNFLDPGTELSPELVTEMMRVKQIFLGGNLEMISRQDLDRSIQIFTEMESILIDLLPSMKTLSMGGFTSDNTNSRKSELAETDKALQRASERFGGLIERNQVSYQLDNAIALASAIAKMYKENWEFVITLQKWMPFIKKIKKTIAGGDEESILDREWSGFLVMGARAYTQYLRYFYFIDHTEGAELGLNLETLSDVVADALKFCGDFVEQKPNHLFTTDELNEVMMALTQAYPDFHYRPEMASEFMKVKMLFFAGDANGFTSADFSRGRQKIPLLREIFENTLPYFSIYILNWNREGLSHDQQREQLGLAERAMINNSRILAKLFETDYDLQGLSSLIKTINEIFPTKINAKELQKNLDLYMPVLIETKNALWKTNDSQLTRALWPQFLYVSAKSYSWYMEYIYFISAENFGEVAGQASWATWFVSALADVEEIFKNQNIILRTEDALRILKSLQTAKVLSEQIKQESLQQVLDVLFNEIIQQVWLVESPFANKANRPGILGPEQIAYIGTRIKDWQRGILVIANWLTESPSGLSQADLAARSKRMSSPWGIADLFNGRRPLALTADGKLNISGGSDLRYDANSLLQLNSVRTLVLWAIHSFTQQNEKRGISLDKVNSLYTLLKPIFVDLDILSKENMTFAENRFREANLFTPHGDGDSFLSWLEGIDEVTFIWSGMKLDSELEDGLVNDCMTKEGRSKRDTTVKLECVRRNYDESVLKVANNLPGYRSWKKANPGFWDKYLINLLKSVGYRENKQGLVKREDLALFPHVVQYIEMVYALHDSDRNGFIDAGEAVKAFPVYRNQFKELAKKQLADGSITENDLPGLFTYVLMKGRPPETILEQGYFKYIWLKNPQDWDTWAGRDMFAKILAYVADKIAESKPKDGGS